MSTRKIVSEVFYNAPNIREQVNNYLENLRDGTSSIAIRLLFASILATVYNWKNGRE